MPVAIPVLGAVSYEPIVAVRTRAGNASVPNAGRPKEAALQTFKQGVPVMLDVSGNIVELVTTALNQVYGVCEEPAHNLTVAGTSQPAVSEGTAQNQSSSVIIPVGAWMRDGTIDVAHADDLNIFSAALKTGQTYAQSAMGTIVGLVKDATSGFWYVDLTANVGNAAVAILLGMDNTSPNDGTNGTRVFFSFITSRRFFN